MFCYKVQLKVHYLHIRPYPHTYMPTMIKADDELMNWKCPTSNKLTHALIITSDMCVAVKSGALNMWIKICIASFLILSILTKQTENRGNIRCDENLSAKARRHFCSESSTIKTIVSTESVNEDMDIETAVDSYITEDYDEYSFREDFKKKKTEISDIVHI